MRISSIQDHKAGSEGSSLVSESTGLITLFYVGAVETYHGLCSTLQTSNWSSQWPWLGEYAVNMDFARIWPMLRCSSAVLQLFTCQILTSNFGWKNGSFLRLYSVAISPHFLSHLMLLTVFWCRDSCLNFSGTYKAQED